MSTSVETIRSALRSVKDPATGQSIVTNGQLAEVAIAKDGTITLRIDLVSPGYPRRDELEAAVRQALGSLSSPGLELQWGLRIPHKPARQDLARLPTVKNVIAVAAGKGGVGKSTVSVNVALALQAMGAAVGILDADIYGPSIPKMLGTPDRPTGKSAEGDGIAPALYRGLAVMSVEFFVEPGAAVIWRGPMIHKLLTQFLEDVRWGELDYLVVDLPPGTGDAQLSLAQLIPITGSIIVTTPQEVALIDVRKAINMFGKLEVPVLGVAENMSYYRCPACGHHDEIFGAGGGQRLAEEIGVELLAKIPIEPAIAFGGEAGVPVVESNPDSPHAQAFFQLAAAAALGAAKRSATGPKRSSLLRTVD
ncbi:MAG: Mrp/NBP35 family ATP-binding protein [Myxococcales bacterium]|nr:Mrp/NBP35 family ATP-binding protein [Myxococcales bacterium]